MFAFLVCAVSVSLATSGKVNMIQQTNTVQALFVGFCFCSFTNFLRTIRKVPQYLSDLFGS